VRVSSRRMSRADSPFHGRMIFNVGARRSGTLWLQRIVTAHPMVASVPSETHLFSHGIAPLFDLFQHSLRSSTTTGRVYVERSAALDGARDLCDAVFAGFLEEETPRLAERTPLHVLHLDLISEIYPDARIVHIVRDGRDVARSIASQRWGPVGIREAASEWRTSVRSAREAGMSSNRYREVRYEALLEDPAPIIRDLYAWLELPVDDQIIRTATAEARAPVNLGSDPSGIGAAKWRDAYTASELEAFEEVAGDLLDDLGYPRIAPGTPGKRRTADSRPTGRLSSALRRGARLPRRRRRESAYEQPFVDEVIGALRRSDLDRLERLMAVNALVRVVSPGGDRYGRGASGLTLLSERLSGAPLEGRQVRGEAFPGSPYAGVVLTFEGTAGRSHVVVFMRTRDARLAELIIYELSDT
jgi:Sulfotransferase family